MTSVSPPKKAAQVDTLTTLAQTTQTGGLQASKAKSKEKNARRNGDEAKSTQRSRDVFLGLPSSPLQGAAPSNQSPPPTRVMIADAPLVNQKANWYFVTEVSRSDNAGLEVAKNVLIESVSSLLPLTRFRTILLSYFSHGYIQVIRNVIIMLLSVPAISYLASLGMVTGRPVFDAIIYVTALLTAFMVRVEAQHKRWKQALQEEKNYAIPYRFNYTIDAQCTVLVAVKTQGEKKEILRRIGSPRTLTSSRVIGVLTAWFHGQTVYITGVYVRSGYRARGVATYLLECLISRAEALRYTRVSVTVPEYDCYLMSWARGRGFDKVIDEDGKVEVDAFPHGQWQGIVLAKPLQAIPS